jgi:membrane-bound ClpP family serine protease
MALTGFTAWLRNNVLIIVLLFVGIVMLARSHKGDHKSAMTTAGIALIALFFIGLAADPAAISSISSTMVSWL